MAYRRIQLFMVRDVTTTMLRVYTDDPSLPDLKISEAMLMATAGLPAETLRYAVREYVYDLQKNHGVPADAFDYSNLSRYYALLTGHSQASPWRTYGPPRTATELLLSPAAILGSWEPAPVPAEPAFEVNMMEALVGWKALRLDAVDGRLHSPSYEAIWPPDEAHGATCTNYGSVSCSDVPTKNHSCGIYATDKFDGATSYGYGSRRRVMTQIYGWGRYVRGDAGWRAQYAYPKSFHLNEDQVELIEPLKAYHVEIFINQPFRIYDPEENGYGYGQDATSGDRGAASGAGSQEDRDTCNREED